MIKETTKAELIDAISAHEVWKSRLVYEITADVRTEDPVLAARDDRCRFGRWLYGTTPTAGDEAHYRTCKRLHAAFHAEAARTLRLVSAGQQAQAQAAMSVNGSFTTASRALTRAMMDWRQSNG